MVAPNYLACELGRCTQLLGANVSLLPMVFGCLNINVLWLPFLICLSSCLRRWPGGKGIASLLRPPRVFIDSSLLAYMVPLWIWIWRPVKLTLLISRVAVLLTWSFASFTKSIRALHSPPSSLVLVSSVLSPDTLRHISCPLARGTGVPIFPYGPEGTSWLHIVDLYTRCKIFNVHLIRPVLIDLSTLSIYRRILSWCTLDIWDCRYPGSI